MKKRLSVIICIVIMASFFSGCSGSGSSAEVSGKKIMVSFSDIETNAFLASQADAIESAAKGKGMEVTVETSSYDVLTQLGHVKTAVSEGYDGIILQLVDKDTASQMIDAAGDLPIAFVNVTPAEEKLSTDKYVYIGSDDSESSAYQAEAIANYFSTKGQTDINVVLLEGEFGAPAAKQRTEGVKAKLKELGINATYVFDDTANWSRAEAEELFTKIIEMGTEYDCVICNNDEMAIGVINAMKANDIDPSTIPIVAVDGSKDGRQAVADGDLMFTAFQPAVGQGEASVEVMAKLLVGDSISDIDGVNADNTQVMVPYEKIDASNVANYE